MTPTTPRFTPGDRVYVRGWRHDARLIVKRLYTKRRGNALFPHWLCTDAIGQLWIIPQIHMSTKQINEVVTT